MKPVSHALTTSEAVRGRLNVTGAARRDAVARTRGELPSYTDEDVEEVTGKFAALAADAAAGAVAKALAHKAVEPTTEPDTELARAVGVAWKHRARIIAKVTGLIATGSGALVALGKLLHLW